MEIKLCAHCGEEAIVQEVRDNSLKEYPFRIFCGCGMTTCNYRVKEIAVDVWNSRVEQSPSEADRWLAEATEQRARADLAEMQRDELAVALEQAKKNLVYAGKMQ